MTIRPRPRTLACLAILGFGLVALRTGSPTSVVAQSPTNLAVSAIRRVLDDQVAAWNRGNLDAFLEGYWRSPRVVFQSGGTRHDGFDAMRDRYRKRYQADGRAMGRLVFSELEIEPLGSSIDPTDAFARGRYTLTMPDGSTPTGLFTLILRRFPDGWKIIHDHTSVGDPAPSPVAPRPTP